MLDWPWRLFVATQRRRKIILIMEIKMFRNRLFNVLIAIALVVVITLTVREAFATADITSQTEVSIKCNSLPSRFSIHMVEVNQSGTRVTYTEDGPTGVDGGLKELFTAFRTCSR